MVTGHTILLTHPSSSLAGMIMRWIWSWWRHNPCPLASGALAVAQTQVVHLIFPHSWQALHFLPSQLLPWGDLPCQHTMASGRGWKHLLNLLPNLYVDISFFIKLPKVIENWPLKAYDLKASWPMKGPLWLLHSPLFFLVSVEIKTTCS